MFAKRAAEISVINNFWVSPQTYFFIDVLKIRWYTGCHENGKKKIRIELVEMRKKVCMNMGSEMLSFQHAGCKPDFKFLQSFSYFRNGLIPSTNKDYFLN